ncbi:MAG: nucleoside-diphosphate kinase [Clostridia bacterium]|nr:nucleoside-diphosphate kinase [Clostridia bacterium]
MERTLVILKPDTVKRKLIGELITRIERKNYAISALKMINIPRSVAEKHYEHVKDIPVYDDMIDFMTSGPVVIMVVEGENVIQTVRNLIGKTNSFEAAPGTIRGDFGSSRYQNLIHASDSIENAEIEIKRFFNEC